jgi:CheY-like chemotaxis protein
MSLSALKCTALQRTILVVDDDEDVLAASFGLLAPRYRVTLAVDGVDGLGKATELPSPELIIADIVMPRLDGVEMALRIRETAAMRWVPIIFLSGQIFVGGMFSRLAAGTYSYLAKTADPLLLLRRVHRSLGDA